MGNIRPFRKLAKDFSQIVKEAAISEILGAPDLLGLKIAILGFKREQPLTAWYQDDTDFIVGRLECELSLESLDWYEEYAEAVSIFSCLALGTMIGLYKDGEIDRVGFLLGEAHLPGFIAESMFAIHSGFGGIARDDSLSS